ncbi:class I SAM-dependent methyltransferase [bacterium]|nr:class I SAM-dependent methyltransferase [bacterium]
MTDTYREHGEVCAKFYQLTVDSSAVAEFILCNSPARPTEKALFVGGMFDIAGALHRYGLDITVVDYTPEMVALGRRALPTVRIEQADLRKLPYQNEFDHVFVVGRVFTHMISNEDLHLALASCRKALRAGGHLFFDNYEDTKIRVTNYFNGTVRAESNASKIERNSATTLLSESPYIVSWRARYTGDIEGRPFDFSDAMEHRAWSRQEIVPFLKNAQFKLIKQGLNFDETSFFNLAQAV